MHVSTLHARYTYPDVVSELPPSSAIVGAKPVAVGDVFEVEVGKVAHGGHMVARTGDLVTFVRHALPGERVRIVITEVKPRFLRADVVEVVRRHPERREVLCPAAGTCGGCDFQHIPEPVQRELKAAVIHESLVHHGQLSVARVDELLVAGLIDFGLQTGWRTRMRYRTTEAAPGVGVVAMYRHRSDHWVDASPCVIAEPSGHRAAEELAGAVAPESEVFMATGLNGPVVDVGPDPVGVTFQQIAVDEKIFEFSIPLTGFWQVHPMLGQAIVDRLVEVADPRAGETWWDLYAGVGPLAAALGARVGSQGRVEAVESSRSAVDSGSQALSEMPWVNWTRADVRRWLSNPRKRQEQPRPAGVVVDPPRSGAGRRVLDPICRARPRVVVVVACDPIALGRDTAILAEHGYAMANLRVWDAFPQTHHMEAMAVFTPSDQIS